MNVVERFNSLPEAGVSPAETTRLRRDSFSDFAALERFHYRSGRPATICTVLALVDEDDEPAACLVVSRPTLNAWWRILAWPGVFESEDKRAAAARVNAVLRTISRVIVDPRYRGIGLASRLVSGYLADPLTPYTDAVAAMGRACPFFERAGMRAHGRPLVRRDRVLLHELGGRKDVLLKPKPSERVSGALLKWANDSRATRRMHDPVEIARAAAAALFAPPVAYTSPPAAMPHGGKIVESRHDQ